MASLAAAAQEAAMTVPPEPSHVHDAKLLRVIDGDTFVALADLGFFLRECPVKVRVHALYCPEHKEAGGPEATTYAATLLTVARLRIQSYKDGLSYERWVCDVWLETATGWRSFAELMIADGHGTATKEPGSGR